MPVSADATEQPDPFLGSCSETETEDWKDLRTRFLNEPRRGAEFFERMNQMIAATVSPGSTSWEAISSSQTFQAAFDCVTDRLLSDTGFPNVIRKYRDYVARHKQSPTPGNALTKDAGSVMDVWAFFLNRTNLVLAEWDTNRRDRPAPRETRGIAQEPGEEPQQPGTPSLPPKSTGPDGDFQSLFNRLARLKKPHLATLVLRLWPLPDFPPAARTMFLPVVLEVSEANKVSPAEAQRRLADVMKKYQPLPEDELLELEARHGLHFASEKHFDARKRFCFGQLAGLEANGGYTCRDGVETELTCDCRIAVGQSAEAAVLTRFEAETIYERQRSGRRVVNNRPLWLRRRFSQCCYRQKYHRHAWLKASLELLARKPLNGPMAHADIAWILNCSEGTIGANLNRARAELTNLPYADDPAGPDQPTTDADRRPRQEVFQQELLHDRLQACVCSDLRPPASGYS